MQLAYPAKYFPFLPPQEITGKPSTPIWKKTRKTKHMLVSLTARQNIGVLLALV